MVRDRNADVPAISTAGHYAERRVESRVSRGAQPMSGMTVPSESQHILIVEDDPGCRALLNAIFDANGFQVTATDSVLGASELIERLAPDVIVLDLALPYRSGASWLVELKADPDTAHIPVVILSAHPTVLPEGRRRLAHAILGKPFQTRSLLAAIRSAR
jgi:DNA-binding response OmpR family regulator